jgi:hypothetical protein
MTFDKAIKEVVMNDVVVWRKVHQFDDDYDRPRPLSNPGTPTPWSTWLRIRMEKDNVDFDSLVFFETNNHDDVTGKWLQEWSEDNISREDILATDWEIFKD